MVRAQCFYITCKIIIYTLPGNVHDTQIEKYEHTKHSYTKVRDKNGYDGWTATVLQRCTRRTSVQRVSNECPTSVQRVRSVGRVADSSSRSLPVVALHALGRMYGLRESCDESDSVFLAGYNFCGARAQRGEKFRTWESHSYRSIDRK